MSEIIHLTVQEPEPINLTAEEIAIIKAVSPTVTTEQITGGWKITITDVDGPHVITLYNGADGRGISSAVLNADYTLTITYTDGTSYTTPSIRGERGAGITSIAYTGSSGLVDTYTITYGDGQTATFTVTNGRPGADGTNAYVWIRYAAAQPTQDSDMSTTPGPWMGVYSGSSATAPEHYTDYVWYEIKGDTPPVPVTDVKVNGTSILNNGVANVPLATPTVPGVVTSGTITIIGSTPAITALPGIQYVCGECATLDVTLPESGIVDVVFESGSTPTVLTVTPPTGKTLSWANGFDPTSLDANTTYEINIAIVGDQCLGVAGAWT